MDEGSGVTMSSGVGCSLDLVLLWLWCHSPAAEVPFWPLARGLPYATCVVFKKKKKKEEEEEEWVEFRVFTSSLF